jgi:hypothetical protein
MEMTTMLTTRAEEILRAMREVVRESTMSHVRARTVPKKDYLLHLLLERGFLTPRETKGIGIASGPDQDLIDAMEALDGELEPMLRAVLAAAA